MRNFSISSTVGSYPPLPYEQIKNDLVGHSHVLSLVFVGEERARKLNKKHRNKMYVPNVLSFPLSKNIGEIYITPAVAKREAKKQNIDLRNYIGHLFVHGLLHVKGLRHGKKMETLERTCLKKYRLSS